MDQDVIAAQRYADAGDAGNAEHVAIISVGIVGQQGGRRDRHRRSAQALVVVDAELQIISALRDRIEGSDLDVVCAVLGDGVAQIGVASGRGAAAADAR